MFTLTSPIVSDEAVAHLGAACAEISALIAACNAMSDENRLSVDVHPRLTKLIPHQGFACGTFLLHNDGAPPTVLAMYLTRTRSAMDPVRTGALLRDWCQRRQPILIKEHRDEDSGTTNMALHATWSARQQRGFYVLLSNVARWSQWESCLLQVLLPHLQNVYQTSLVKRDSETSQLTLREREVLSWVCQGKSNQEIATILGISNWTVKVHVGNVLCKLNACTRGHAVAKALAANLVPPSMERSFRMPAFGGDLA